MAFQKPGFRDLYAALETDLRRRAPALTDWEEGSVVRSLFESFAYEMALLYEQMESVYNAGFVDTATGANLDRVVAVLGITRNEPDFATGVVTFERDPGGTAAVTIPAGTLVTTPGQDGARKAYLTIEDAVLQPGQTAADARVQAEARGAALTADSETVTVMPRPVPGVRTVRNARPIRFLGRERETDEELRDRAKNALLASGRASATSIENALLGMPGVRGVRVVEDFPTVELPAAPGEAETPAAAPPAANPDAKPLGRGVVQVFVDGLTPDNAARLAERVDEVRAAGVLVRMEPAVAINVEAVLQIEADPRVRGEELAKLEAQVADAVVRALDRQRMGEPLLFTQLTREVLGVEGVTDLTDFRIITFRESGTAAVGTVRLTRPAEHAAAGALPIPRLTELRTAAGQRFQTTKDLMLDKNATSGTVDVQALRLGREGELMRTGSAVDWEMVDMVAAGTRLTVRNEKPIRLDRVENRPDRRRLDADVEQRFVVDRVRVAVGKKTLAVHVRIPVTLPSAEGAAAAAKAVGDAITAAGAAARAGDALMEGLDTTTKNAVNKAVDGWFAAVRDAAAGLGPIAGDLDAATVAALVKEVGDYFTKAKATPPVKIVENDLLARLKAVLDARLTPDAVRALLEPQVSAALTALRAALPPFPADRVAAALRAGLRRAADAASTTEATTASDAEAALRTASAALSTAADALRARPNDATLQANVTAEEAKVRTAQTTYESAARALEKKRTAAARTLETELARVDERVAALEAAARAALAGVDTPTLRASVATAAGAAGGYAVGVRLRTVGYDGDVRPDQPFVEPSFVETPEAATVFVYTRTVRISGTIPLTLPFSATEEDRQRIRAEVTQGIDDYLDALGPEEPVALETLRDIAAGHPRVVSTGDFTPAPALASRLDRGKKVLTIRPMEKAASGALVLED
jgi:uncharacterized phage protein gp47/JayE